MSAFIPGLRFHWLTHLYDPFLNTFMRDRGFKQLLVAQVGPMPGQRILDVGCGTGTLTLMLKQECPDADVLGLDADEHALAIARAKANNAALPVEFHCARVQDAELPHESFDSVVSSLLFHHLAPRDKADALCRMRDWLRPAGSVHVLDFTRGANAAKRLVFGVVRRLESEANTRAHASGEFRHYLDAAGFGEVVETRKLDTLLGTLALYRAIRA